MGFCSLHQSIVKVPDPGGTYTLTTGQGQGFGAFPGPHVNANGEIVETTRVVHARACALRADARLLQQWTFVAHWMDGGALALEELQEDTRDASGTLDALEFAWTVTSSEFGLSVTVAARPAPASPPPPSPAPWMDWSVELSWLEDVVYDPADGEPTP